MKLATFNHNGRQYVGIIDEKVHVLDVADMCALIDRGVDDISSIVTHSLERAEIELLAPIVHPRQDIICLGMNYLDHEKEAADFGGKAFERRMTMSISPSGSIGPVPQETIPLIMM